MIQLTCEDIECILGKMNISKSIVDFSVSEASDKMLGFLSEYWKLKVKCLSNESKFTYLNFFIKCIPKSNNSKADMVKELKLFDKELNFYSIIKNEIDITDMRPWSAKLIWNTTEAFFFQDLAALNFKLKNRFDRFDIQHTLEALKTLARFHASTIIFEETKSKNLKIPYRLHEEYKIQMDGYNKFNPWFMQCMQGALEAVKKYSKFIDNLEMINAIETVWESVWHSALEVANNVSSERKVICHRDLWNNNIMFHYQENNESCIPDDCVLVDFQAIQYQPPSGDVMLLLYCNLEQSTRESNMKLFLDYYYDNLRTILSNYEIDVYKIFDKNTFLLSADKQRQWALIVYACLLPQIWVDDDQTSEIFCDENNFNDVMCFNKGRFIIKMMQQNKDYKTKVMEVFEEIVEKYCV